MESVLGVNPFVGGEGRGLAVNLVGSSGLQGADELGVRGGRSASGCGADEITVPFVGNFGEPPNAALGAWGDLGRRSRGETALYSGETVLPLATTLGWTHRSRGLLPFEVVGTWAGV